MSNSTVTPSAGAGCSGDASSLLVLQIVVAIESVVILVGIIAAVVAAAGGWDEIYRNASTHLNNHTSRIRSSVSMKVSSPCKVQSCFACLSPRPPSRSAVAVSVFFKQAHLARALQGGKGSPRGGKDDHKQKQPWEIDFSKLRFLKKIGTGNFGEVWKGTWVGSEVAIKTVLETVAVNDEFMKRFVDEIHLMSVLHHRGFL